LKTKIDAQKLVGQKVNIRDLSCFMALFPNHNKGDVESILTIMNHHCNVNPNLSKISIVFSIKKQEPQTIKESGN
jgi:hypothetical protein